MTRFIELIKEVIDQQIDNSNVGYRVGDMKTPSESLESRGWYFQNKVGYMGTGFYFFGKIQDAKALQKRLKSPLYEIDLDSYKLYKAGNPKQFYLHIRKITQLLGRVDPQFIGTEELQESLEEIADILINKHAIGLPKDTIVEILNTFVLDIQNKNKGTLLTNRLLEPLGYDGIDNRDVTELDHYGVGSVLFRVDPSTVKQVG